MDGDRSKRQPHDRTVRGWGGYRAFVPAPLPPSIAWDAELVGALSRADQAIGRLAGEGGISPWLGNATWSRTTKFASILSIIASQPTEHDPATYRAPHGIHESPYYQGLIPFRRAFVDGPCLSSRIFYE